MKNLYEKEVKEEEDLSKLADNGDKTKNEKTKLYEGEP